MNDDDYDEQSSALSTGEEEVASEEDEIDPEFLEYIQNSFQDEIRDDLFERISSYLRDAAIPICEYLTREDVEIIIQNLAE